MSDFSLGPLVGKVKDYQVEVIVDTLCSNMVGDKEQLRDISSIGLKTVINELPLTTQTLAATGKKLYRDSIHQIRRPSKVFGHTISIFYS